MNSLNDNFRLTIIHKLVLALVQKLPFLAFVMSAKQGDLTRGVTPKAKVAGVKRTASRADVSLHEDEAERKRFVSFTKTNMT